MEYLKYEEGKCESWKWYYDETEKLYHMFGDINHRVTIDKYNKAIIYTDDWSYELPTGDYQGSSLDDAANWAEDTLRGRSDSEHGGRVKLY